MNNYTKVNEKILCEIWKSKTLNRELKTIDGESVSIINSGNENTDSAGPDFKNAKVRIGNLVYIGDVEIDPDFNDWKAHGHHLDKRYNKVILHATLLNKNNLSYVFCKDGRKIHTICLADFLEDSLIDSYKTELNNGNEKSAQHLKCAEANHTIDQKIKLDFLDRLGKERFKKKTEKIYSRLKELVFIKELSLKEPVIKYDLTSEFLAREFTYNDFKIKELWQQVFYEFIFEALGYSKNKNAMIHLAQFANTEFITSMENSENINLTIQSCLFNIAGIIPEELKLSENLDNKYLEYIIEFWNSIKEKYDGRTLNFTDWHFFRQRPQNFPTIRIAGGSILLRKIIFEGLIDNLISRFERIRDIDVLIKAVKTLFIVNADGYWKDHFNFGERSNQEIKYFIGSSRADEIIVNVVLPFVSIYGDIFGKNELKKKVENVYSIYSQNEDNSIVKFMADSLLMENASKNSVISQGLLELFRTYCSKNKCLQCSIGATAFN
ncbi:MAG: DUF2851 family protein [Ignavibacteriales bacterium]|nr:DUF2851 family protein [Ignavibacteriales bacterium]